MPDLPPADSTPSDSRSDPPRPAARRAFFFALLLVGLLYVGAFATPWVYDDLEGIRDNPALRGGLADLARVFDASPPDSTPYGRPLVALSLAVNHALDGLAPAGYRALNLALHLGAALLLADLLRTALAARPAVSPAHARRVAAWSALLFAAHPLATTVVTYTVQRAEGLMAFFYLGALAASARALASPGSRLWPAVAVACCACGMASKETMLTAPLAVLLLHRAAFASSWREVARRRGLHLALASTWLVLAACMLAWPRARSVGFASEDMGALAYLNLQTGAWWRYLGLFFAPWRSAIDYWPAPVAPGWAAARGLVFAALLLGAVAWLWRRSPLAALGLALPALILLPTSTVVPIFTSPVADHRLYLPAAFGLALLVAALLSPSARPRRVAPLLLACALAGLSVATVAANRVYRSAVSVWENAVARDPGNARAWNNLGLALSDSDRPAEGESATARALSLRPDYADAWYNLGTLQGRDGRLASAEESLRRALALRPDRATTHGNLAVVLARRGRPAEARRHYEEAIRLRPDYPAANFNLAVLLLNAGDPARARPYAEACLRADPAYPRAQELVADLRRLAP